MTQHVFDPHVDFMELSADLIRTRGNNSILFNITVTMIQGNSPLLTG